MICFEPLALMETTLGYTLLVVFIFFVTTFFWLVFIPILRKAREKGISILHIFHLWVSAKDVFSEDKHRVCSKCQKIYEEHEDERKGS